ncbi:methyltransferase domain-containing protein [Lentzea sp. NBC_00516]|uniref:class I SAM-dependent methyltransferase n=1 Tax=Lentzea sp. NBC_00516 TaxID=2903582 RepID=UPI002E807549|nr:class I SAM-dependent methyltransferase [Lentzea sp. NBC_00516]WUD27185.1 methyltransferase domain-containing protein [Lentzea sp. NBC_00516]
MIADLYDDAYASFACSPTARHLFGPVLDSALPAGLEPYSFVTSEMLALVRTALREIHVDMLVDLGCGRGGPGLWLARELSCALVGVDRSRVAAVEANSRRSLFPSPAGLGSFVQADMQALPIRSASVDAVVSIDALQTSETAELTMGEISRILRPGGRFVATTWQAVDLTDHRVAPRLRVDFQRSATAVGFDKVRIREVQTAHEAEMELARTAVALDPRLVGEELILQRIVSEAVETLTHAGLTRRIILAASKPKCCSR